MSTNMEKYLNILDALADALGSSEGQSTEEVKLDLMAAGMDVDAALAYLKKVQEGISRDAKRLKQS